MAELKATIKAMYEGIINDLMIKTKTDNVYLPDGVTLLSAKLSEIVTSINSMSTDIDALPTVSEVNTAISNAIDALIDGAPGTYDTLKEISDWIATHTSEYEALIAGLATKVDKVEGKGLSTEDYTTAEKTKLAGIAEGANAYTLPTATASVLGGVKIGANISVANDGTISGDYSAATTSAAGLMSAADKTKLEGIEAGATATTVDSALSSTSENPVQNKVINAALAGKVDTVSGKGLSTNDYTDAEKTKLAGIAEGANAYTLPAATSNSLGGVKVGSNLAVANDGTISGNYSAATTSSNGLMSAADKTKLDGLKNVIVSETQPANMSNGDVWIQIIPAANSNSET